MFASFSKSAKDSNSKRDTISILRSQKIISDLKGVQNSTT